MTLIVYPITTIWQGQISNSYTLASEGLKNLTAQSPKAKPEVEGGSYSIILMLPWYNYFKPEFYYTISKVFSNGQRVIL